MKTIVLVFIICAMASSAGAATLIWTDNSDNEAGFKIYKSPTATGQMTEIAQVGANVTTFSDPSGATDNCYQVSAFNAAGESAKSNVACVPLTAPAAPGGLTVTP